VEPSDFKAVAACRTAGASPSTRRAASLNAFESLGVWRQESQLDNKDRQTAQEARRWCRYRQLSVARAERAPRRRSRPRRHCPRTEANDSAATMKRKRSRPPGRDVRCLESPLIDSAAEEVQLRTRKPVGRSRSSLNRRQSGHGKQVSALLPPLIWPTHPRMVIQGRL
jgi:hypothetical protein